MNTLEVINTTYGVNQTPVIQLLYHNGSSLVLDKHNPKQMDLVLVKIRNAIKSRYVITFTGFGE